MQRLRRLERFTLLLAALGAIAVLATAQYPQVVAFVAKYLGNGNTLIDIAEYQSAGATFDTWYNAAVAAHPGMAYTSMGLTGTQTLAASITVNGPFELGDLTLRENAGVSIVVGNNADLYGHGPLSVITKANTTTDYTPIIMSPLGVNAGGGQVNAHIHNIRLGATTPGGQGNLQSGTNVLSGLPMPITGVSAATHTVFTLTSAAAAAGGYTVYTGTLVNGGVSPGWWIAVPFAIAGFTTHAAQNNGAFACIWTSTTLTCNNPNGLADSSGGTATVATSVYTGTIAGGASNAYAGYEFGIFSSGAGAVPNIDGYWVAVGSTGTTLTLANAFGVNESITATAFQSGGWGIAGAFSSAQIYSVQATSDQGILVGNTGCSCYNWISNNTLQTLHGALYLGNQFNSSHVMDNLLWANDDQTVGLANASGYGLRMTGGGVNIFHHQDIENAAYLMVIKGSNNTFSGDDGENDLVANWGASGGTTLAQIQGTFLTLQNASTNNQIEEALPVNDYSGNNTNIYGSGYSRVLNNAVYGSVQTNLIPTPGGVWAKVGAGSGSTTYNYWVVGVDGAGNWTGAQENSIVNGTLTPGTIYNILSAPTWGTGYMQAGIKSLIFFKGSFDLNHYFYQVPAGVEGFGFIDDGSHSVYTGPAIQTGNQTNIVQTGAVMSNGTTFTVSGCSASSPVGGPSAGSFKSGTTGTCTVTVTMGGIAAPHGWFCPSANDLTTTAHSLPQTATSTTGVTFSGPTVSGDSISFGSCTAY